MKIGFSLSPGGLLLPYHLGALASLSHHGYITDSTPLAGSSAGAIAVASHASGVPSLTALEAATRVSSQSTPLFIGSGGLLPSLKSELEHLLPRGAHEILNEREGMVGLAHRELFPRNRSVLQTYFNSRSCLVDAICDSSMFPYFLTNRPVRMVRRQGRLLPRLVVDGVFACAAERIGCPDFGQCQTNDVVLLSSKDDSNKGNMWRQQQADTINRTVMVSVFPTEFLSLSSSRKEDQIGPAVEENIVGQTARLVRMATRASSRSECKELYQQGFMDAELWVGKEDGRRRRTSEAKRQRPP